jgi:hypothetical protein
VVAVLAILAVIVALLTGILTIHGWDWSVGTDTHYCGVFLPNLDFYCQAGS